MHFCSLKKPQQSFHDRTISASIPMCEKILRDSLCYFGAADCIRNPFKIGNQRNPYVKARSMTETERMSNTVKYCFTADMWTDRWKHSRSRIPVAAFSAELKPSDFSLLSSQPRSPHPQNQALSGC